MNDCKVPYLNNNKNYSKFRRIKEIPKDLFGEKQKNSKIEEKWRNYQIVWLIACRAKNMDICKGF